MLTASFGDIICTTGDCSLGDSLVQEMKATFESVGSPARFKPTVDAIMAPYLDLKSTWGGSGYIPFSASCCSMKALGLQAQKITADMLSSVGAGPLPDVSEKGLSETALTMLKWGLILGGVGVLVFAGIRGYEVYKLHPVHR